LNIELIGMVIIFVVIAVIVINLKISIGDVQLAGNTGRLWV